MEFILPVIESREKYQSFKCCPKAEVLIHFPPNFMAVAVAAVVLGAIAVTDDRPPRVSCLSWLDAATRGSRNVKPPSFANGYLLPLLSKPPCRRRQPTDPSLLLCPTPRRRHAVLRRRQGHAVIQTSILLVQTPEAPPIPVTRDGAQAGQERIWFRPPPKPALRPQLRGRRLRRAPRLLPLPPLLRRVRDQVPVRVHPADPRAPRPQAAQAGPPGSGSGIKNQGGATHRRPGTTAEAGGGPARPADQETGTGPREEAVARDCGGAAAVRGAYAGEEGGLRVGAGVVRRDAARPRVDLA
jgi:hypothetical protein